MKLEINLEEEVKNETLVGELALIAMVESNLWTIEKILVDRGFDPQDELMGKMAKYLREAVIRVMDTDRG